MEVIKYLTGIGKNITGEILVWDGALMEFRRVKLSKNPACLACGKI
jgi:adenylyltransferase/sulfurtransferase